MCTTQDVAAGQQQAGIAVDAWQPTRGLGAVGRRGGGGMLQA